MAAVYVKSISSGKWLQIEPEISERQLSYDFIKERLFDWENVPSRDIDVKLFHGTHEIRPGCPLNLPLPQDVFINTSISLLGGKGGFGSMLRAIGAQIEKTTNREACRDLSGRRLRDINEEKRLKDWVTKQAEREREKEERKQKKLEKLKQEFHHEFHDPEYNKERAEVIDKVHEALEQGIVAASSSEPAPKKRKAAAEGPALKKTALWVGVSDDESISDDSESDDERNSLKDAESEEPSSSSSEEKRISEPVEVETTEDVCEETSGAMECVEKELPTTSKEAEDCIKQPANDPIIEKQTEKECVSEPVKTPEMVKEPVSYPPVVLENYICQEELETLGLDHLKEELQRRGLKCGGTVTQRAQRLFSIKGLTPEQIPPSLFAKPPKKQ